MDKFTETLEKYVLPFADKVSNNKSLQAIMSGFMTILPITLLGAIGTLLGSLQIPVYQEFITNVGLKVIFGYIPGVTTNMLALYAVYSIAKAMTENPKYDCRCCHIICILNDDSIRCIWCCG